MTRILVIDDDSLMIQLIKVYLKGENYEILSEETGKSAVKRVTNEPFDLILLDIMLPDATGYEVCQEITSLKKETPVIMITSLEDDISIEKAFEAGSVDYIRKPISRIELVSRVKNVLDTALAKKKLQAMYENIMKELEVAKNVQSYFIPEPLLIEKDYLVSSFYQASSKVGGDLFDIKKINSSQYLIYIGDISGHGVQAALLMAAIKFVINMIVDQSSEKMTPASIMTQFNEIFCNQLKKKGTYLTICLGILDTERKQFLYYNAGHPAPFVFNNISGEVSFPKSDGGIPVGWVDDFKYLESESDVIDLGDSKTLLLYTDGIFESKNRENGYLGMEGFKRTVSLINSTSAITFPHEISKTIADNGFIFEDDYTLVAVSLEECSHRVFVSGSSTSAAAAAADKCGRIFDEHEADNGTKALWKYLNTDVADLFKKKCSKCSIGYVVRIAVHEWLMNIARHGTPGEDKTQIIIETDVENLEVKVFDFSAEWDFESVKARVTSSEYDDDQFRESGRGIQMILTLTEKFEFKRIGGMNKAYFKFKRQAKNGEKLF